MLVTYEDAKVLLRIWGVVGGAPQTIRIDVADLPEGEAYDLAADFGELCGVLGAYVRYAGDAHVMVEVEVGPDPWS